MWSEIGKMIIDYLFRKLEEYEVYDLLVSRGPGTSASDRVWRVRKRR